MKATQFHPSQLSGYTGHIFELEVLGECRATSHGYMRFYRALREVEASQSRQANQPTGEAKRFRDAVAQAMGIHPLRLHLYSAVGSALDHHHGVDGFFTFDGIIITVDTTINPHKDVSDARVIVTYDDAVNGYEESARQVAGWFNRARVCNWKGVI